MSCEDAYTLTAYADGQCPPAERGRVDAHVKSCAECRGQLRWQDAMKAALAALPAPRAPAELKDALRQEARLAARRKAARLRSRRWSTIGLAAGLAAAAALVLRPARPAETVSLDELLAAHRAYALTMPLTSQEIVLTGLADALAGRSP